MKKIVLLFVVCLFATGVVFSQKNKETYFKFSIKSVDEVRKITRVISIDNVKDNTVWAYANTEEFTEFLKLGYDYKILPAPSSLTKDVNMASSISQMSNWDAYPTYDAYITMMNNFVAQYPNICQMVNIGTTTEGRQLIAVKISDNPNAEEDEPEFFFTSSMHGDETTGYVLMLRLIDYLLTNYPANNRVANLVNHIEIYINPLANPDGTYAGGNNSVSGATRSNANGVDINRNFKDPIEGDHPDGYAWQMETIAMMQFAENHSFALSGNFHGGIEVVNYPWDCQYTFHPDDTWLAQISRTYADTVHANSPAGYMTALNNGVTNGAAWYLVYGGRQDNMTYFHRGREITFEISNTKLLPASQLPAHWNYNWHSFILYMEECLYGIRGIVTNTNGDPVLAKIKLVGHDSFNSETITDPQVGDYHRLINSGTYTVEVSAFGYITQQFTGVVVANHAATILDVVLQPAATLTVTGTVTDNQCNIPIEGATIQLLDTPLPTTTTNVAGEFSIANVLEGTYSIKITKNGYLPIIQTVNISTGSSNLNFVMTVAIASSFETGFESGWTFGGNVNWQIDNTTAYDGLKSAKSGTISHSQSTYLTVTKSAASAGEISFYLKVSSEGNYDKLYFYVDDVEKGNWSGNIDWQQVSFPVSAGNHIYKWTYSKDGSASTGSDCAWIDFVMFPAQNSVNHPPTYNSTPVSQVFENELYTYTVTANDLDGNPITLAPVEIPAWLTFTPVTSGIATLSGVAPSNAIGNHNVIISMTDGIICSPILQQFTITVAPQNYPPTFTGIPAPSANVNEIYTHLIVAVDANNDALQFAAPTLPSWLDFVDNQNNTASLSGTPTLQNVGINTVVVTVTDGYTTVEQSFTIEVINTNVAPVITSTPVVEVYIGQAYEYKIMASDQNTDNLTFTMTSTSNWLTFTNNANNTATLSGTPAMANMGDNPVTIQVTDGQLTVEHSFMITVLQPNVAPQITTTPVDTAYTSNLYTYEVAAVDANGNNLTFTAENLPSWLNLVDNQDNTATISGTPHGANIGDVTYTINVTDGLLTEQQIVTLHVVAGAAVENFNDNLDLFEIYPNPAQKACNIQISLLKSARITLTISDMISKQAVVLAQSQYLGEGTQNLHFDCSNLPKGIYLCTLQIAGQSFVKKLIVN